MTDPNETTPAATRAPRFYTFSSRAQSLHEARERHAMVAKAESDALAAGFKPSDLDDLWVALAGRLPGDQPRTELDRAVDVGMPRELFPLLRAGDDLPAAAAFVLATQALKGVDCQDDMALRAALEPVWQKLLTLDDEAKDVEEGFGCDRSGAWRTVRHVREVSTPGFKQKMLEIARLAGHMHAAMSNVLGSKQTEDPHEVTGAELGGDLARLTGAERARLADPELGDMQALRVLEERAAQHEMHGRTTTARGRLVLTIDESGSMHDERGDGRNLNGRNTWAKATALALARIALAEGRAVSCIHFSTVTSVQEVKDHDSLVEMCASFDGGGTDFEPALKLAAKLALPRPGETEGADVVFVTDGKGGDGGLDAILDGMDAAKTRLWTVGIGQQHRADFPLRKRAEKYVFAHDDQLKLRKAAVGLAVALTGAASKVAAEDLN